MLMGSSLRESVELSQRLPVTAFRENTRMPRPTGLPAAFETIGKRARWWREFRKIERDVLAKRIKMSPSGLADFENGRSARTRKLHLIAAELRLNAHYLETGDGEPEAEYPQEAPPEANQWPFEAIPPSRLKKLNAIELNFAESKLLEALQKIETERRKMRKENQ